MECIYYFKNRTEYDIFLEHVKNVNRIFQDIELIIGF